MKQPVEFRRPPVRGCEHVAVRGIALEDIDQRFAIRRDPRDPRRGQRRFDARRTLRPPGGVQPIDERQRARTDTPIAVLIAQR
jgi:hypothetical protein